ncbi:MAG: lipid IV(A) 3-deoxy-D-manno-octulosonic acid transferase [Pseudomonadota bacterium]
MRPIYSLLLYLLTPFVLLRLLWRSRQLPEYRRRIGERFGWVPRPAQDVAVWVHAVSVGETLAALPLIRALIERHGERRVLVTTTTPTGSARVREALGDRVLHVYAPYDLPHVVARFIRRMQPQRAVIMETELWPNLFRELRRRGVPLVVANARLSPRSFAGYGRVRAFTAATLADCTHIAAQSEADAQRFRALGAPDERVSVMGNIKLDQTAPQDQLERGQALRERLGGQRPAWVAASTHEGEEEIALAAHRELLRAQPGALLILVPRHPQRFDAVARQIEKAGLAYVRRSALETIPDSRFPIPVLLGDSMGEMFMYFAACDVAFVGGSLVPIGGHNVLEPALLGKPVLFGPHMHNFVAARELLMAVDAAVEIRAASLADALAALLADPQRRARMGGAGHAAVAANRGARERLLALIERS